MCNTPSQEVGREKAVGDQNVAFHEIQTEDDIQTLSYFRDVFSSEDLKKYVRMTHFQS